MSEQVERTEPDNASQAGQSGAAKPGGGNEDSIGTVGARAALAVFVALITAGSAVYLYWLLSAATPADPVKKAEAWLAGVQGGSAAALLMAFGPLLGLFGIVAALLAHFGLPKGWKKSVRRSLLVGTLLGACVAAAWFIGTARLEPLKQVHWLFFVPAVPPLLLAFQAMVMWRQRPRSVGDFRIGVSADLCKALVMSEDERHFNAVHQQLVRVFGGVATDGTAKQRNIPNQTNGTQPTTSEGVHTPMSFAFQFALPCLLLLVVGFGAMALATQNDPLAIFGELGKVVEKTPDATRRGIRWGVAGAFSYVFFTFGSRCFRNDLTVGAALWAIITLITGPALAAVVALVGDLTVKEGGWQSQVVLFFAGLAPRQVMGVIETVALKFLGAAPDLGAPKLIPLSTLRGVGPELAARLREENIEDVTNLAYADPIRLVQSMPYDLRQIVEWIDQAQLVVALPKQHEALLDRGVTGAIDLAWRWLQACAETQPIVIGHAKSVPESFKLLMPEENEAKLVYETARQMFYEEHVRLLWVMYNSFSTTAGDGGPGERATPPDVTTAKDTTGAGSDSSWTKGADRPN
jgi:hypothetical protein